MEHFQTRIGTNIITFNERPAYLGLPFPAGVAAFLATFSVRIVPVYYCLVFAFSRKLE